MPTLAVCWGRNGPQLKILAPSYGRISLLDVLFDPELTWAPREKRGTLGSWSKMFRQKLKGWISLPSLCLHGVNVDVRSCIIFEVFPSIKMRSKSFSCAVSVFFSECFQWTVIGLLVYYNLCLIFVILAIVSIISNNMILQTFVSVRF